MKRFLRYTLNTIATLIVAIILSVGVVILAMQFPVVQTALVARATEWVSEKLDHKATVGRVNIKWFDALSLENVTILDSASRPMIQVGRLDINHDFWYMLLGSKRKTYGNAIDAATLYKPFFWLIKDPKTGDLNLDYLLTRIEQLTSDPNAPPSPKDRNIPFLVREINLIDGTFRWEDPREPQMTGKAFDYNHFTLQNINGSAKNLTILGDTIAIKVNDLHAIDQRTRLNINDMRARVLYCRTKLELADLYARVGNSVLTDYLAFHYKTPAAFGNFNNEVKIVANLNNALMRSDDLGWFAESLFSLNDSWEGDAYFEGYVNDFKITNADIDFGKRSYLKGDIAIKNATSLKKAFFDFNLNNSRIEAADLKNYYSNKDFDQIAQKLEAIDLTGSYKGTLGNFDVKGKFKTALGDVEVRQLQMNLASKTPTYLADVYTKGFNLGKLLDNEDLGEVEYNGKISGRGFDTKNLALNLESKLNRFTYNGYTYRNVVMRGNWQKEIFEGLIMVRDSNLKADLDGTFDFSGNPYAYYARGKIEKADLRALRFTKDSLVIHTELDVNLQGNTIDDIVGNAKFLNSYATLGKRNLVVDTLLIDSRLSDRQRKLHISSEFLNFDAEGVFEPTKAVGDLVRLFDEYSMYFFGDEAKRTAYYEQKNLKNPINRRYSVDYKINFKEMDKLMAFLYPSGFVSNGSYAEGVFVMDRTSIFSLTGKFDTLRVGSNTFYNSDFDLNTSKFTNTPEVLASAIANSEKQQLVGIAPTEKLSLEAAWTEDHIDFRSGLRQRNSTNRAALNGEIRLIQDYIYLQFKRSRLRLLDDDWNIDPNNLITIEGANVTFSNLNLQPKDKNQLISLNGDISTDSLKQLNFEMRNFELATLNPVLNINLSGTSNATVGIRDIYDKVVMDSKLDVQKLTYNNFLIGNILGTGEWDPVEQHLHINADLDKAEKKQIAVVGTYTPSQKNNEMDLIVNFNDTDISVIEPFARGLVSDLSGRAAGTVTIKGSPLSPVLNGELDVKRGRLKFDYLQAIFAFEDKIYFGESDIRVKKLLLTDPEGNTATLSGGVFHDSFRKFSLGFDGDLRNFRILNTTIRDNELFYGTAYATGKMEVFGPINNLNISTNLISNRGTRIYIPLDGAAEVASEEFVQFIPPPTDSTTKQVVEEKIIPAEESIIKMDFRLNITPDAYCEIQFNRQTGEAIKAYGNGLLNLKIDTEGTFNMAGAYEIQEGDYQFSLSNGLLRKNFDIQRGSRISWTGDPYGAMLDVKASYVQNAILSPLSNESAVSATTRDEWFTRRYPVEVILNISDRMVQPQLSWDIKFKEYPANRQLQISAAEARLKRDEQYMARQVSTMLLFGQLLPEDRDILAQSAASGLNNNISELVSNQLSRWLSSISDNLELGVSSLNINVLNPSTDPLSNLQLRFSYRFLNDRFRITRDGRLSYGQNQYDATSLLLDWTLEYWLTDDGSQRFRMYNRNIQNQFTSSAVNAVSYGASYLFTRSFNSFRLLGPKEGKVETLPDSTATGRLTTMRQTQP